MNKPRKWWLAALLSLLKPGLGHIYNGQAGKGALDLLLPNCENLKGFLGFFGLSAVGYYFFVFADAVGTARKFGATYQLKPYNRGLVYLGLLLLLMFCNIALAGYVKHNHVQAYKIPSASNEPTLLIGDQVLADRRVAARLPRRGDLIVFEISENPPRDFIKRVVAAGGDRVELRNKTLWVNDEVIEDSHVLHEEATVLPAHQSPRDNFGPVTVPPGAYFVLGDNRDRSYDSRFFGFVEQAQIKGTVTAIYWSWDRENAKIRWERIGTKLF
ncbi:MAG: signal peptidase I [Desulfuromonadaceae bacterium]